jgi:hypothetical protein
MRKLGEANTFQIRRGDISFSLLLHVTLATITPLVLD